MLERRKQVSTAHVVLSQALCGRSFRQRSKCTITISGGRGPRSWQVVGWVWCMVMVEMKCKDKIGEEVITHTAWGIIHKNTTPKKVWTWVARWAWEKTKYRIGACTAIVLSKVSKCAALATGETRRNKRWAQQWPTTLHQRGWFEVIAEDRIPNWERNQWSDKRIRKRDCVPFAMILRVVLVS